MALNNILPFNFLRSSHFLFQVMRLPNIISDIGAKYNPSPQSDITTMSTYQLNKNFALPNIDPVTFTKNLSLLCDSIEFPGQTLTPTDYRIPGTKQIKVPYMRDYSEITASFYYPENVPLYDFFNGWIDRASPQNTRNEFFDDIIGEARIIQFLQGGESEESADYDGHVPFMSITLRGMYPLSIVNMPVNWSDDGLQKINISFFFEEIEIKTFGRDDEKFAIDRASKAREREYTMSELNKSFEYLDSLTPKKKIRRRV